MDQELTLQEKCDKLQAANEELQYEIDYMNSIFDKYVLTTLTDINGKILSVSEPFVKMSGYKEEELLERPHSILRHEDMPSKVFKELWETISNKEVWRGEVKNRKKDGGYYWVDSTVIPLLNSKKQIVGYRAIRIDITHAKEISDNFSHHMNEEDYDEEFEIIF
jgi:PAS domain S-box-containing protein